jgi:hypothetical protein
MMIRIVIRSLLYDFLHDGLKSNFKYNRFDLYVVCNELYLQVKYCTKTLSISVLVTIDELYICCVFVWSLIVFRNLLVLCGKQFPSQIAWTREPDTLPIPVPCRPCCIEGL